MSQPSYHIVCLQAVSGFFRSNFPQTKRLKRNGNFKSSRLVGRSVNPRTLQSHFCSVEKRGKKKKKWREGDEHVGGGRVGRKDVGGGRGGGGWHAQLS